MNWTTLPAGRRWQLVGVQEGPCRIHGDLWRTLAWGWVVLCTAWASGQSPEVPLSSRHLAAWEYRPYQIAVWLVVDRRSPQVSAAADELIDWLPRRSHAVLGAAWHIDVQEAPTSRATLLASTELPYLTWEKLFPAATESVGQPEGVRHAAPDERATDDLETKDKVFFVRLTNAAGMTEVLVRELDVRTRQLGPLVQRSSASRTSLPLAVWDALMASFAPLARIERVEGREVTARLRAGGLWTSPVASREVTTGQGSSETSTGEEFTADWLEEGAAYRPILRHNRRDGRPEPEGVQPLPWTLLEVQQRDSGLLRCRLHSAFRSLLPPRGSTRLERLALAVRPGASSTTLVLRSRGEGRPLAGYEFYLAEGAGAAGDMGAADSNEATSGSPRPAVVPVGVTDERGQVTISGGERRVMTLLVQHGRQPLARLPLVPGQPGPLTIELPDDDPRLVAEALAQSITVRSLDLVARREVLASRLRAQAKAGQPNEARELLEALRRLPSRTDLTRDLERFRQQVSSPDRLTQARIDKVFAEAQNVLLQRPLSDELVAELSRELASAGR